MVDILLGLLAEAKAQIGQHCRISAARDFEIAAYGQVLEDTRNLELSSDARAGDLVLFPIGDVGVVQKDAALRAFGLAGHEVHQGGLAGAVGAEQDAQLTILDRQRHTIDGLEPAEVDTKAIDGKRDLSHLAHSASCEASETSTAPCGAALPRVRKRSVR